MSILKYYMKLKIYLFIAYYNKNKNIYFIIQGNYQINKNEFDSNDNSNRYDL